MSEKGREPVISVVGRALKPAGAAKYPEKVHKRTRGGADPFFGHGKRAPFQKPERMTARAAGKGFTIDDRLPDQPGLEKDFIRGNSVDIKSSENICPPRDSVLWGLPIIPAIFFEESALPEGMLDVQAFEVREVLVLHRWLSFSFVAPCGIAWLDEGSRRSGEDGRLNAPPSPRGEGEEKETHVNRQTELAPTPWQTRRAPSKDRGAHLLCQLTFYGQPVIPAIESLCGSIPRYNISAMSGIFLVMQSPSGGTACHYFTGKRPILTSFSHKVWAS